MLQRVTKKEIEQRYFDRFCEVSGVVPQGRVESNREAPDFIVHSHGGLIGIELTRLFRPRDIRHGLPREQESLAFSIMDRARQFYEASAPAGRFLDLHVYFNGRQLRKTDVQTYAEGIVALVEANMPNSSDQSVTLNADDHWRTLAHLPGIAYMNWWICEERNFFAPSFSGAVPHLGADYLQTQIDAKNKSAAKYDPRCAELWLILAHGGEGVPSMMSFEDTVPAAAYRSVFSRLFLFEWPGRVQEISRAPRE